MDLKKQIEAVEQIFSDLQKKLDESKSEAIQKLIELFEEQLEQVKPPKKRR